MPRGVFEPAGLAARRISARGPPAAQRRARHSAIHGVLIATRVRSACRARGSGAPCADRACYSTAHPDGRVSGVPDFGRAIFRVDGRRYIRRTGLLRIRLRRCSADRYRLVSRFPPVGRTQCESTSASSGRRAERSTEAQAALEDADSSGARPAVDAPRAVIRSPCRLALSTSERRLHCACSLPQRRAAPATFDVTSCSGESVPTTRGCSRRSAPPASTRSNVPAPSSWGVLDGLVSGDRLDGG